MKFDSFSKRIKALQQKLPHTGLLTSTEEWQDIKDFCLSFLEDKYPDVHLALIAGFDQIEAMDKSGELKKKQEPYKWHMLICLIGQVLNPYLDARVALAAALIEYQEGVPLAVCLDPAQMFFCAMNGIQVKYPES